MSLTEALEATADLVFNDSLPHVVAAFQTQPIIVPLSSPYDPEAGSLELMTGYDKFGQSWVYVYSSEEEATAAGLVGKSIVTMPFQQLLSILDSPQVGGVLIDAHKDRGKYLISADYFASITSYLADSA